MNRVAYLLLLFTALSWGGNAVAGKLAVGHVSPMLLATLRWGVAALALIVISRPQLAADRTVIRTNLAFLIFLGTLGLTGFNVALYAALHFTSAINVSIEQAGIPMLIFLGNFLFFRLKPGVAQMAGFVLSLLGVALTVGHGELRRVVQLEINFGDALMLVAVVAYAGYTIALRYTPDLHWQSLITVLCVVAFFTSMPFAVGEWLAGGTVVPDATGWAVILYAALLPSIIAQIFYIKGVQLIGANRAGMFINMVPIFGALLSIVILAEAFHGYHALAMALVLGGIWLSEIGGRMAVR